MRTSTSIETEPSICTYPPQTVFVENIEDLQRRHGCAACALHGTRVSDILELQPPRGHVPALQTDETPGSITNPASSTDPDSRRIAVQVKGYEHTQQLLPLAKLLDSSCAGSVLYRNISWNAVRSGCFCWTPGTGVRAPPTAYGENHTSPLQAIARPDAASCSWWRGGGKVGASTSEKPGLQCKARRERACG